MEKLIGHQLPRLESVPPYVSSRADEAIDFAEANAGLFLDPWQKHVLTGAMGVDRAGLWTAFEVKLLVARQNGKGSVLECRELFGLYLSSTDRVILHTAHESKTATQHFWRIWGLIESNHYLRNKVRRHSTAPGREFIELKPAPTIILGAGGKQIKRSEPNQLHFIARTAGSGRGFTADMFVYDEDMILDSDKVGASLPSMGARPNPQVWYTGSAGFQTSTQLGLVRRRGVAAVESVKPDGALAFYEWSIRPCDEYCPKNCTEHDDPESDLSVAKANPGLGIRRSLIQVHREKAALDPENYLREILSVGVYPAPLDGWGIIPKTWFSKCADKAKEPERVTSPIFSLDIELDRSAATISVAGRRSDDRVGIQMVERHEGTGWIVKAATRMEDEHEPECWIIDKRTAAGSLITDLEEAGLTVVTINATEVAYASGLFYDGFRDDKVRHYDQEPLRAAIAAGTWRKLLESRAFDRVGAVGMSPLMSAAFAYWGFLTYGYDYDARESVDFSAATIAGYFKAGVYGLDDIRRLRDAGLIDEKDMEALALEGIRV